MINQKIIFQTCSRLNHLYSRPLCLSLFLHTFSLLLFNEGGRHIPLTKSYTWDSFKGLFLNFFNQPFFNQPFFNQPFFNQPFFNQLFLN